jgi:(2R)-3-sulfolactate dehydrogenase (NADP+)
MMMPAGGIKGAMLALIVELLCCSLTGASFGFEADSFFTEEGNRPRIGQAFMVIDPAALAGNDVFNERIETLVSAMLVDPDVRLPGKRHRGAGGTGRTARSAGTAVNVGWARSAGHWPASPHAVIRGT